MSGPSSTYRNAATVIGSRSNEAGVKEDLLEYAADVVRNRETFLLNFPNDFRAFDFMIGGLREVWSRVGVERDRDGHFHTGLLPLVNLLVRHSIFGFQHMAAYQSFLAWLTFRPGLEAFLMLGKWVDDPANAEIWRNRHTDRNAYTRTFSGRGLVSAALPRSEDLRAVLSRLNDEFMHSNPEFTYRDMAIQDEGPSAIVAVQYFDTKAEIHEGHLLAYLNLVDEILWSSYALVNDLFGLPPSDAATRPHFAELERERSRAKALAARDSLAKKIMEELGMWRF